MLNDFLPSSILVLCTGNICRSPMAEALLREALPLTRVSSAGIGALVGYPADPEAVDLMAERGVDISAHRARAMTGELGTTHDLILTMSMEQRGFVERRWRLLQGRVFTLGYFENGDIADPFRQGTEAFRTALAAIDRGVGKWRAHLAA